ncbi:carbohydrate kinase [Pedobacter chinensis]|uniref:Carbohydrate kinase n=1 Tax=Pedobacter chinensis TaxID=2282421 RepID=A0A369PU85_9SPHI|nr:carbohydrate kinase [Pedobacter chinensis]RDC54196.1 carbohydrate kinase [Pedobacter chinensis]
MSLKNKPIICFGEVLWDVLPDGPQPGGAPLNVAYHLNKLGLHPAIISRVGNDDNGKWLTELMDQWNLDRKFVQIDEEHQTSEVVASLKNGNEVCYEIVFPVAWDFITPENAIVHQAASAEYLIYGSLSSRNDITRNTLFELLEGDAIKVLDINLRYPFVKRAILEPLLKKADIIKFNEAELDTVQTLFGGSYGTEREKVAFVQERFSTPEILITKGESGAAYYIGPERFYHYGAEVRVKDTIGSGDAFLAAFISGHRKRSDPAQILKNAIAMGAFIATQKGACPDYELEEYLDFQI